MKKGFGKMKKKNSKGFFFKCLSNNRVRAVIFELGTIPPLIMFEFYSMSSKIERTFEEEKNKNMGQKDHELSNQKTRNPCKIPNIRKKHILRW